jgi:hypothetical protein
MKKLITMIGLGAALCLVPACKKSNIAPKEATASNSIEQRDPGLPLQPVEQNTSLYVMLASKACLSPQKEYTSLKVEIRGIRFYTAEEGWQALPTIDAGWDLVSMQQGTGLNITNVKTVSPGTITRVAIIFGDHNELVVNDRPAASCFKLGAQEVIIDLKEGIKANAVNELLVSIDICGHIGVQQNNDGTQCYILKPVMEFQRLTQKMIK